MGEALMGIGVDRPVGISDQQPGQASNSRLNWVLRWVNSKPRDSTGYRRYLVISGCSGG